MIMSVRIGTVAFIVQAPRGSSSYSYCSGFCRKRLVDFIFDPLNKTWMVDGAFSWYDPLNENWSMPIEYINDFIEYLRIQAPSINIRKVLIPEYKTRDIEISLNEGIVPRDNQKEALEYLCDDRYNRKGLSLIMGMGKTFSAIYSISHFKKASIIIISGLLDQWINEILKCTNLKREDIYLLKLTKSIHTLLESKLQPKIIVASLETVREYIKKTALNECLMPFEDILIKYGIGVKIFDEVHLKFLTTTQIDLRCPNVPQNFYLSGTFKRNNPSTNKIFKKIYPKMIIFKKGRVRKHINTSVYAFWVYVPDKTISTKYGYNHCRFEKYLMKNVTKFKRFYNTVLIPIIEDHFINLKNKNEKCLIYFSTIDFKKKILPLLQELYPNLKVIMFTSKDVDAKLLDADIVLSNFAKLGTGKDVPKVRTVINTISTKNDIIIEQVMERARPIPDVDAEFVTVFNANSNVCVNHYKGIRDMLKTKSNKYAEIKIC